MIKDLKEQKMFCLIAPDGETQYACMGYKKKEVVGLIEFFNTFGITKSYEELKKEGFTIQPVTVSITETKD